MQPRTDPLSHVAEFLRRSFDDLVEQLSHRHKRRVRAECVGREAEERDGIIPVWRNPRNHRDQNADLNDNSPSCFVDFFF